VTFASRISRTLSSKTWPHNAVKLNYGELCQCHDSNAVVLKVVDIVPRWSIGQSKGSVDSHGVTEWPGGQLKTAGVYWSNETSNSKLLLIGQRKQTAFFKKSNKIKISGTVV